VEADITHFISAVELQGSPTALHRWQGRRKTIGRFRSGASNREEHIMAASPAGPPPSSIKYGRIPNGYCVRIEGRGDMRQSPAVESLATRSLEEPGAMLVLDLAACSYLDSTMIGCALGLHRHHGAAQPPRFVIAASQAKRRELFGAMRLHTVLRFVDEAPAVVGHWMTVPLDPLDTQGQARHVMECHRALSQAPTPQAAVFAAIADQLARELEAHKAAGQAG
jgi:anti-anti-sigma regulatory factor